MGSGIAHIAALSGLEVHLYDVSPEALDRAGDRIRARIAKGVELAKVTPEEEARAHARLKLSPSLDDAVAGCSFVIEAAPEDMALKRRIFAEIEGRAPGDCLLGTNTSSLSVTELAQSCSRPDRVVGLHFFNPPHLVTLLEIVVATQTSDAAVAEARELGALLGRDVIVVRDYPGFATSRLGLAIGLEAMRMVEEGVASAEDIDRGMELGYRFPMGPLRLSDLVGLDVRLAIAEHLHRELGERFRPPVILRNLVRAGKLGKKSGEGFFRWER
jgi:3-hydroxybutyryl-CoA dehydrogenase